MTVALQVFTVTGTKNASGDNTLITGASGRRIVLVDITLQNESATATTMVLYDAASQVGSPLERFLGQTQGSFVSKVYPVDYRPKCMPGQNLVLNLSGANSCGYTIHYYYE